jgi:hypothetical protein
LAAGFASPAFTSWTATGWRDWWARSTDTDTWDAELAVAAARGRVRCVTPAARYVGVGRAVARLGVDRLLRRLLADRRADERAERVLFALVANRALEPLSKLAATRSGTRRRH